MPKTYLTFEDREKQEKERAERKENLLLSGALKEKIWRKLGYDYICRITGLSEPTVCKIVNHPEKATVTQLRAVCAAAEIPLSITAEV